MARIVGGSNADPLRYPYQATVVRSVAFNSTITDANGNPQVTTMVDTRYCGGSLINSDIVLTAGHCVDGYDFKVLVNLTDFYNPDASIKSWVTDIRRHPDYSITYTSDLDVVDLINDIALLKLSGPIWSVDPVQLNNNTTVPYVGELLQVMGLGQLQEFDPTVDSAPNFAQYLQVVTVQSVNMDTCIAQYQVNNLATIHPDLQLCTALSGKSPCEGDSGGPLVLERQDFPDLQVGIASFAAGCARADFSNVYTRVSTYFDWIQTTICELSSDAPDYCSNNQPTVPPVSESPVSIATPTPISTTPFASQAPVTTFNPIAVPSFLVPSPSPATMSPLTTAPLGPITVAPVTTSIPTVSTSGAPASPLTNFPMGPVTVAPVNAAIPPVGTSGAPASPLTNNPVGPVTVAPVNAAIPTLSSSSDAPVMILTNDPVTPITVAPVDTAIPTAGSSAPVPPLTNNPVAPVNTSPAPTVMPTVRSTSSNGTPTDFPMATTATPASSTPTSPRPTKSSNELSSSIQSRPASRVRPRSWSLAAVLFSFAITFL